MAITVSLINMKGGVGKSTLTVNLAWSVADLFGKPRTFFGEGEPDHTQSGTQGGARLVDRYSFFSAAHVSCGGRFWWWPVASW